MQSLGTGGGGAGRDRQVSIRQISDEVEMQPPERPIYVQVFGHVSFLRMGTDGSIMYPSCPLPKEGTNRLCMKKLRQDTGNGDWYCEAHGQSVPAPEFKYLLTLTCADWSGGLWCNAIGESCEALFGGKKANEMQEIMQGDYHAYEAIIKAVNFGSFNFKLKVAQETYNEETRTKYNIMSVQKPNYAAESKRMLEALEKMRRGEPCEAAANASGAAELLEKLRCQSLGVPLFPLRLRSVVVVWTLCTRD